MKCALVVCIQLAGVFALLRLLSSGFPPYFLSQGKTTSMLKVPVRTGEAFSFSGDISTTTGETPDTRVGNDREGQLTKSRINGGPCLMRALIGLGRLGNRMFVYAALRGITEHCGCLPVLMPNDNGAQNIVNYFRLFHNITNNSRLIESPYTAYKYRPCCKFNPKILSSCENGTTENFHFRGYFQSFKYFEHIRDQIREEFTPREEYLSEARKQMSEAVA